MATSPGPPKILPLTAIRFFAAFYVLLYHSLPRVSSPDVARGVFQDLVGMGYIGVSFFFMLSGFILAIVYLKDKDSINKRRFFVARFARIYPLYVAAMLLDTPHFLYAQLHLLHANPWQVLLGFFLTAGLVQAWLNMSGGLNPPGWSLSTEAFFYLMFPFLGKALWKMRGWMVLPAAVAIYLAGLGVVQWLSRIAGSDEQSYNPLPHLFVFALGVLLARGFVWIGQSPERSRRWEKIAPWGLLASVAATIAIPIFHWVSSEALLQHGILAPLFAVAILACSSGNRTISRLLSQRWLVILGEASYGLYLIHYPLHSILRAAIERYGMPVYLLYVVGSVGLSVVSYFVLEVPARRWILEKERVRSQESEVASALAQ